MIKARYSIVISLNEIDYLLTEEILRTHTGLKKVDIYRKGLNHYCPKPPKAIVDKAKALVNGKGIK